MTLIVGTNSYVDEAYITNYATERGITLTGDVSVLGIRAMDYLNSLNWKGQKTDPSQPLDWPRMGVYVDGVLLDSSVVPSDIEQAQAAQAIEIDQGNDPTAIVGRATKKEKLGTLEVEYMDNASNTYYSQWVSGLLRPYLSGSGGAFNINVGHA